MEKFTLGEKMGEGQILRFDISNAFQRAHLTTRGTYRISVLGFTLTPFR